MHSKLAENSARGHSLGQDAINSLIPTAAGGDTQLAAIPAGAISSTNIPGLAGTTTTGNNQRMRQLLSFFAGSLSNVSQGSWITDPKNMDTFSDYKNFDHRIRDMHNQNEASAFFKDDWKVRKSLTLNLGVRWAYFGVPWESDGLMPLPVGGGDAMFGISGRGWDGWMRPGATRRCNGPPVCRQGLPESRHSLVPERLEQHRSRSWIFLAGPLVWRRQDHSARRIPDDVSNQPVRQQYHPGNQRARLHRHRQLRPRQQRSLPRSHEVDPVAVPRAYPHTCRHAAQTHAAESPDGPPKPTDLYSGCGPEYPLRSEPDPVASPEAFQGI